MDIKSLIPVVNSDRNYWLVRTQGGEYYGEFLGGNFIGIGWNEISDIKVLKDATKSDDLVENIKKLFPDEKRPNHALRQIRQFVCDMKKGDIVIVPAASSKYVSFGEIIEDEIYFEEITEEDIDEGLCEFTKRRSIRWLKTKERETLDPYLYMLLYSHHTITNANSYSTYIDRSINTFFIKNDEAHFILRVNERKNIPAMEFISFINDSMSIVDEFNKINQTNLNKYDVDLKANVNSPGPVEIFGNIDTILVIGFALVFIVGGGVKFKKTLEVFEGEAKSDGLIDKIIKLIEVLHKNKLENKEFEGRLAKETDSLKVSVPLIPGLNAKEVEVGPTIELELIKDKDNKEE